MTILQVKNLSFAYHQQKVIDHLSFSIQAGKITTLLGPNGVGKSTLLNCLLGINDYHGQILINGRDLKQLSRKEIAQAIAYVPQYYQTQSTLSVFDYLLTGRTPYLDMFNMPKKSDYQIVEMKLKQYHLTDLRQVSVNTLSGGQMQFISILKALVQEPKLLILDEPMAALDLKRQKEVITLLKKLAAQGVAILLTTHQPDHALILNEQIGLMGPDYFLSLEAVSKF